MYTSFFGLNEKPFAITPDPRYLFMSERHGEGLAHLVYGVTESGGFIQLTGEVGTGKTTLVRSLLGQLPDEVDVALILNPQISAIEFLLSICEELKVTLPDDTGSSKALVDALNRHLLDVHARGRRVILLVDEAQNLAEDVLEQVRLLTNLETAKQKLLQIILIGQPELRDLLAQNNLRQLAQRVTGRYHLEPLSQAEAIRYIDHRIRVAGALTDIFDNRAKRAVFRASGGIPRLINVICDRALLGAYSRGERRITPGIVRRAAAEVSGDTTTPVMRWLYAASALAAALVIGAGIWVSTRTAPEPVAAVTSVPLAVFTPQSGNLPPADGPVAERDNAVMDAVAESAQPPLDETLRSAGLDSDVDSAMDTLFALWGLSYEQNADTGCAEARTKGLDCLYQRGSWKVLEQLNRPAMLTLTDSTGTTHHPVLTALDGELAELGFGSTRLRVPIEEVADLWYGQYLLMWRPPNGEPVALRPGSRGSGVLWLRQSLARLDGNENPGSGSDYFDNTLEQKLREFQREHRLQVDGLAGQQTQILINSLLQGDGTPRLVNDAP